MQFRQLMKLSDNLIVRMCEQKGEIMDITVRGNVVHIELGEFGWVGVIHSIGSFQAATLKDLIDLIKHVLERM